MTLRNQEYNTLEEAMDAAYELAIKVYQFCTGNYWEDSRDELNGHKLAPWPYTDEEVTRHYQHKINEQMNYCAIPTNKSYTF